jgi:hypothetical protein
MSKNTLNNLIEALKEEPKSKGSKKSQIRITYSKHGQEQKADFYWQNGLLQNESIQFDYSKDGKKILLSPYNTEKDLLELVKKHAYGNRAELTHRDYKNITYAHTFDKTIMDDRAELLFDMTTRSIWDVYKAELVPIINRNKWVFENSNFGFLVLGYYDEDGELDNIPRDHKDGKLMENMLNYFFKHLRISSGEEKSPWNIVNSYIEKEELNKFLTTKLRE